MFAFLEGSFGGTYSTVSVATPDGSGERDLVSVNDVDLFVLSPAGQPASPFVAFDLARAGDRDRLSGPAWSPDGTQVRLAVLQRRHVSLLGVDLATRGPRLGLRLALINALRARPPASRP